MLWTAEELSLVSQEITHFWALGVHTSGPSGSPSGVSVHESVWALRLLKAPYNFVEGQTHMLMPTEIVNFFFFPNFSQNGTDLYNAFSWMMQHCWNHLLNSTWGKSIKISNKAGLLVTITLPGELNVARHCALIHCWLTSVFGLPLSEQPL